MKPFSITFLFILCSFFVSAQINIDVYPNFIGQPLSSIECNTEWHIVRKANGDINKDKLFDIVLILESRDSVLYQSCSDSYMQKNKPRIILVLFHQNGLEKTVFQNNQMIALGDEGGMLPFLEAPDITIEKGLLTIYYQYTRSNQSYTFEYKKKNLYLLKASNFGVESVSGDYEDNLYNFKKGEIQVETGNISTDVKKTEIIKFNMKPKSLSDFGKMYDWEIVKGKSL